MEENARKIFASSLPLNTNILKVVPEKSIARFAETVENSLNVFTSIIPINTTSRENNLNELLELREDPPKLVTENDKESGSNEHFIPKSGKTFTSKNSMRQKVRTLKDVRKEYENFYLSFLDGDLKTQQRLLMRKVRDGSIRDTKTIMAAKQLLEGDVPLSRSSWRMLMNINPKKLSCPVQFVLYDGKKVRVSGSLGGQKIFLNNHDLRIHRKNLNVQKDGIKVNKRKRSLLESSVNIKFKPGPLSKKKHLDESYQRHNIGPTQTTDLPNIGVLVSPKYGTIIEPFVLGFLKNFHESNNTISDKWADFALSALGSVVNNELIQGSQSNLIFPLSYKNDQSKILMRKCNPPDASEAENTPPKNTLIDNLESEVIKILDDILDAVDIHLNENIFFADEEFLDPQNTILNKSTTNTRDKGRMKYAELHRLDVTLLKCNDGENEPYEQCSNSFCSLGCVCSSLNSTYILRGHCGKVECMFGCNCYGSDSKSDLKANVPSLLCLEKSLNATLAKEEKKFHQTVVLGESTGLTFRPKRRHCKTSDKFEDFIFDSKKKLKVKNEYHIMDTKDLKIFLTRLDLTNVEPWCMIHNVYKCFCNGKFTSTYITDNEIIDDSETDNRKKPSEDEINFGTTTSNHLGKEHIKPTKTYLHCTESITEVPAPSSKILLPAKPTQTITSEPVNHKYHESRSSERLLAIKSATTTYSSESANPNCQLRYDENKFDEAKKNCARTAPYQGRQYSQNYYTEKNMKIFNMEIHDSKLHSKLRKIIQRVDLAESMEHFEHNKVEKLVADETNTQKNILDSFDETDEDTNFKTNQPTVLQRGTKLAAWLEKNYKCIQKKIQSNSAYINLGPPIERQVTLHPWEGIVQRYLLKKNVFLVTKTLPNRLFIAVNPKLEYFKNCINIETIKLEDLRRYPSTIQQIVTNICEKQNSFFILYGRKYCWEIVGSVTKLKASSDQEDDKETTVDVNDTQILRKTEIETDHDTSIASDSEHSTTPKDDDIIIFDELNDLQKSQDAQLDELAQKLRWFVLPTDDDIKQIQFYMKGFFVTYDRIKQATINARLLGETILLSAAVCVRDGIAPQFGVYVTPHSSSVVIGPYEEREQLGFEIITINNEKKTNISRGHWFETKKIENISFLNDSDVYFQEDKTKINKSIKEDKQATSKHKTIQHMPGTVLLPKIVKVVSESAGSNMTGSIINDNSDKALQNLVVTVPSSSSISSDINDNSYQIDKKLEMPVPSNIKSNYVFNSSTDRIFDTKLVSSAFQNTANESQESLVITAPSVDKNDQNIVKSVPSTSLIKCRPLLSPVKSLPSVSSVKYAPSLSPIKTIKPIKIKKTNGFYHLQGKTVLKTTLLKPLFSNMLPTNLKHTSMKILKPSEINNKLSEFAKLSSSDKQDLEDFLASTPALSDKTDFAKKNVNAELWSEVWLESTNIKSLGHLKARLKESTQSCNIIHNVRTLSFQFPGFCMTKFYEIEDAFNKINQALSRKVLVPKQIKVQWRIIYDKNDLQNKNEMCEADFGPNIVLTRFGLKPFTRPINSSRGSTIPKKSEATDTSPAVIISKSQEKALMQQLREICIEISSDDKRVENADDLLKAIEATESTKTDTAED